MTEKLYDQDSHMKAFRAKVLDCRARDGCWLVTLDRTAFFPEGGGQSADTGLLGGVQVTDVHEKGGVIYHRTSAPLAPGAEVTGELHWPQRFRRMQNHTGEHILSGLVYARYGYHNVGFHLGDGDVTVDFDGELDRAQLLDLEDAANQAVAENVAVRAYYPTPGALKRLKYRSKLSLTDNVRLVRIPGYDLCACCAPHVVRTGEIGIIKVLDFMRHRGGIRLQMLCGLDALDDYRRRYENTLEISGLLSAKQLETAAAVRRVTGELAEVKAALNDAKRTISGYKLAALPQTAGNLCFFEPDLDMLTLRELVNGGMEKCGGICAGFTGPEGDYKYIIGSRSVDLQQASKAINTALRGRGGGKPEMIQGSAACTRKEIEDFFAKA